MRPDVELAFIFYLSLRLHFTYSALENGIDCHPLKSRFTLRNKV